MPQIQQIQEEENGERSSALWRSRAQQVTIECTLQIQMHCGIVESTTLGGIHAHYTFGHYFKMEEPQCSALYER